mmetsp:Transcript_39574/g.118765  ORF Transcript_39574/g.118765 Transcript_39574/m.118765 type:complete len:261 (-) Transcript_39574:241-1023(-)
MGRQRRQVRRVAVRRGRHVPPPGCRNQLVRCHGSAGERSGRHESVPEFGAHRRRRPLQRGAVRAEVGPLVRHRNVGAAEESTPPPRGVVVVEDDDDGGETARPWPAQTSSRRSRKSQLVRVPRRTTLLRRRNISNAFVGGGGFLPGLQPMGVGARSRGRRNNGGPLQGSRHRGGRRTGLARGALRGPGRDIPERRAGQVQRRGSGSDGMVLFARVGGVVRGCDGGRAEAGSGGEVLSIAEDVFRKAGAFPRRCGRRRSRP